MSRERNTAEDNVFVSLGSNLGDRWSYVRLARILISSIEGVRITGISAPRKTKAVGLTGQPCFVNQVLRLTCTLGPERLMRSLLKTEMRLGRRRRVRWGPRTIDLDILYYGGIEQGGGLVTLPHPEVRNRPFFLEMITEIDPEFLSRRHGGGGAAANGGHPC